MKMDRGVSKSPILEVHEEGPDLRSCDLIRTRDLVLAQELEEASESIAIVTKGCWCAAHGLTVNEERVVATSQIVILFCRDDGECGTRHSDVTGKGRTPQG